MRTSPSVQSTFRLSMLVAFASMPGSPLAQGQESAHWLLRAGLHPVQPKPDGHSLLSVGDGVAATLAATYMMSPHWGIELMTALPVEHDVKLKSGGQVGNVKHVPPTLSLQYRFLEPAGRMRAYVGVGLNYTRFISEHTTGAWAGSKLELDRSYGPAAQVGFDMDIGETSFIGIDARWFDIDSNATLNGTGLGTLQIDPYAVGLTIGKRLR